MYFVQKFNGLMEKELFQIEYVLKNGSPAILWKLISSPSGLSEWFADDISEVQPGIFDFKWGKSSQKAERLSMTPGSHVRFHWLDEPDQYYFEFRIEHSELTGGIVLKITDFTEPDDVDESINLWNSQVENLTRRTGM